MRESQVRQLQTVMDNLLASLGTLTHPQMIRAAEKQYADAEDEMRRLQQELATSQVKSIQPEQIRALRDSCGEIFENWPNQTRDEQREVLHTYLFRVEVEADEDHTWRMTLYWIDGQTSNLVILGTAGPSKLWTEEETMRLVELMESEAGQLDIAGEFPDRTWGSIRQRYALAKGDKSARKKRQWKNAIRDNETYRDYEAKKGGQQSLANMENETCPKRGCLDGRERFRRGEASVRHRPARRG